MNKLTISSLQNYLKEKDHNPELADGYFQKLVEEVGELSKAIRKKQAWDKDQQIKGSIAEELSDILYYTLALANIHNVDLEEAFDVKERLNAERYNTDFWHKFISDDIKKEA